MNLLQSFPTIGPRPREPQTTARDARRMSLLFTLDFQTMIGRPDFKRRPERARCCLTFASRVRGSGFQLSFLFNCDDVALPALRLDPDTELAREVPADVEVRQRAVLHDVECSLACTRFRR